MVKDFNCRGDDDSIIALIHNFNLNLQVQMYLLDPYWLFNS